MSPNVQASLMYLDAVRGRFTRQNRRSDMHSERTKEVVACARNFGHLTNARIVTKLPKKKQKYRNLDFVVLKLKVNLKLMYGGFSK